METIFVTLPLHENTETVNTVKNLLRELSAQSKKVVSATLSDQPKPATESQELADKLELEILRRFGEVKQRAQKAEQELRRVCRDTEKVLTAIDTAIARS